MTSKGQQRSQHMIISKLLFCSERYYGTVVFKFQLRAHHKLFVARIPRWKAGTNYCPELVAVHEKTYRYNIAITG